MTKGKDRRSTQETRADVTTQVAKAIIDAETEARDAKTARLRKARLLRDAETSEGGAAAAPTSPKPKAKR